MEYMTLADYYQQSPNELVKGIVQQLRYKSVLLDQFNLLTTGTLAVKNTRESNDEDADVPWVEIGEELGSTGTTKPEEVQSRAFTFGSYIDTDHLLVEDKTPKLYDPRKRDTEIKIDKMIRQFSDVIINNTVLLNAKAPVGLKSFIDTYLPTQKRVAETDGLDLDPTNANYAGNNMKFWRLLDYAKDMIDGGATHILCNDQFIRCAKALQRESGMLTTTKDALGRDITSYDGMAFVDVGRKSKKTGTRIITDSEKVDGTAGTPGSDAFTSIYPLRMDPGHFQPWQFAPLEAKDLGRIQGSKFYRTAIEWTVGYMITDQMSVARIYGLKME